MKDEPVEVQLLVLAIMQNPRAALDLLIRHAAAGDVWPALAKLHEKGKAAA